jgi:hypothetical protein
VPPFYVQDAHSYGLWIETLLGGTGAHFDHGPYFVFNILVDAFDEEVGLEVPQQRLLFGDGSFLEFDLVVDEELQPVEYSFHFQEVDGRMIWRKDLHPGHEEELGAMAHIHNDPNDEDQREFFEVVEVDEVVGQIQEHQELI